MYKSTPITKKAKTAREYNSALKQVDLVGGSAQTNPGFKSYDLNLGDEGKKGKEITETVNTDDYDGSGGYMDNDKWAAWLKTDAGKAYTAKNTKEVGTGKFEPDEPGTPDEIIDYQTKRKAYKDNVGDLENREMNRVTKKAEKDVRRGKIKSARSQAKGYTINEKGEAVKTEDGKLKGKAKRDFMKKARQKAKAEERAAETRSFKIRAANAAEGQASGQGLDTRFRSKDVDESQADFTRTQQGNMIAQGKEQEKLAKDKGTPMRAPLKKNYFKKY